MVKLLKLFQGFIDFLLIIFAFFLAYFFRLSIFLIEQWKWIIHSDYPIHAFIVISSFSSFITVFFFYLNWRYSNNKIYKNLQSSFYWAVFTIAVFIILYFFSSQKFFSRLIPIYAFWIIFFFNYFSYLWFKKIFQNKKIQEKFWRKILIIWANKTAEKVIEALRKDWWVRNIVWILDSYWTSKKEILWIPVLWKLNSFEKIILEKNIEEIVQCDNFEHTLNISTFCKNNWLNFLQTQNFHWLSNFETKFYKSEDWINFFWFDWKKLKK